MRKVEHVSESRNASCPLVSILATSALEID
jgi:hypothetical protein